MSKHQQTTDMFIKTCGGSLIRILKSSLLFYLVGVVNSLHQLMFALVFKSRPTHMKKTFINVQHRISLHPVRPLRLHNEYKLITRIPHTAL